MKRCGKTHSAFVELFVRAHGRAPSEDEVNRAFEAARREASATVNGVWWHLTQPLIERIEAQMSCELDPRFGKRGDEIVSQTKKPGLDGESKPGKVER